ncbi:MAG: ATP-binding cassette domain-containing protein [Halobacteriota archaeon]|nr:ATP-binding cassette domain-containing protein [Halobacteriota archaeon]
MNAIESEGLIKVYDGIVAVDRVSINVSEGELFGLLGPNGAGKTTLINLLSTMIPPTGGSGRVWGHNIIHGSSRVRSSIGVVFQDTSLDDQLTGRENLDLHGRLYGMSRSLRREKVEEVLKLVELSDRAKDLVKTYSGGMMRRLEIARGLMHHPKVLFLDEPTLGLDPQTRAHIWEYIKKLNEEEGITMILTTHYMDEADKLCDRIAIMDGGKIIITGTPESLKSGLGGDMISLEGDEKSKDGMEKLKTALIDMDFVKEIVISEDGLHLTVKDGKRSILTILEVASRLNVQIEAVELRRPTLEDVFLHHTGKAITEGSVDLMDHLRYKTRRRS